MKERVERKIVAVADETDENLRVHAVPRPTSARENDHDPGHQLVPVPAHHIRILGLSLPHGRTVDPSLVPQRTGIDRDRPLAREKEKLAVNLKTENVRRRNLEIPKNEIKLRIMNSPKNKQPRLSSQLNKRTDLKQAMMKNGLLRLRKSRRKSRR